MSTATINWRSAPPFTINRHTEYPVNCIFAAAKPIDWFSKGVDQTSPSTPFTVHEFPVKWHESPAQSILSRPSVSPIKAHWFYGEAADFKRLVGNATKEYGS